jgi:3-deoxy-7-phosphoheptulonate synthase
VTWSAVGARTTESPAHRGLAAALPCPVGFKNTIGGRVAAAINGVIVARSRQPVITIDDDGRAAVLMGDGNRYAHLILRGGGMPNYDRAHVDAAARALREAGVSPRLMVDCGHGNAVGDYRRQMLSAADVADQIAAGSPHVLGVMLESHLRGGAQSMVHGLPLVYGQSVTDGCLDLSSTREALDGLADSIAGRTPARAAR